MNQPTHEAILDEIKALRAAVQPVIDIVPELQSMADIYTAGKVGGSALKWLAGIGGILIGTWAFVKAVASTMMGPMQ